MEIIAVKVPPVISLILSLLISDRLHPVGSHLLVGPHDALVLCGVGSCEEGLHLASSGDVHVVCELLPVVKGHGLEPAAANALETPRDGPGHFVGLLAGQRLELGEQRCPVGDHQQGRPVPLAEHQPHLWVAYALPVLGHLWPPLYGHPALDRDPALPVVASPSLSPAMPQATVEFPVGSVRLAATPLGRPWSATPRRSAPE